MHFDRTSILVILGLLGAMLAQPGAAKPSGPCKYWCKHEDAYFCCPKAKAKHPWGIEELLEGWQMPSWLHYFWPILFQRSWHKEPWTPWGHQHEYLKPKCPEVRPSCSRSLDWYEPPKPCDSDAECSWGYGQKCCYDVCLDHKVCKPVG